VENEVDQIVENLCTLAVSAADCILGCCVCGYFEHQIDLSSSGLFN
jgi:hypothetical protein